MRRLMVCCWVALLGLLWAPSTVWAEELMMVRSELPFPRAQPALEEAIQNQGYVVSQAQRVDIDLVVVGFSRGNYRVVSFGRPEELKMLSTNYPELLPFLPQQVVIFGERDNSLLVALSPLYLKRFYNDPQLVEMFDRWTKDLEAILEAVRVAELH